MSTLRGRIIDVLALRVAATGSVVGGAVLLALMVFGTDPLVGLPWAVLTGQIAATVVIVAELLAGPLRPADVVDFLTDHGGYALDAHRPSEEGEAAVDDLASLGLSAVATVIEPGLGTAVYDVYLTGQRLVGAVVGRKSGDTLLVSELDDGGVLVTAQQLLVVDETVRVTVHPGAGRRTLAERHREMLFELARDHGVRSVPLRSTTALALLNHEVESWRELGPWFGSMLRLNRRHNWGLGVAVEELDHRYRLDDRPPAITNLDAVLP